MNEDDKKLQETFAFKQGEIKRLLREARFKTIIRTVAISALGFVLLSGVILSANAMLLNEIANSRHIDENLLNVVAAPNTYISHHLANDGFLVGQMEYITYRIVGNRPVYDGTQKIKYSIVPVVQNLYGTGKSQPIQIENQSDGSGLGFCFYSKVGNRELLFYHPELNYPTYRNDLNLLDDIGADKYLELALSFDRSYTLEEVQGMIPGEVKIAWYWVDTFSRENLDKMQAIAGSGPRIFRSSQVYGMEAITGTGEIIDEPWRRFITALEIGRTKKNFYRSIFQNIFAVLSNGKEEITKDDIRVIGAVVTGDTAAIRLLPEDCVKAATLGIVIDKY
jgi:hypothetical protein